MPFGSSELILNADNSIYHLNLLPEDIADTVITVGDLDRVSQVSCHFDSIEIKKGKREFIAHTGVKKGKRITVISTGIGTDNIDIVLNELDALANIDFKTRTLKEKIKKIDIIRIGTSGAIQSDIPVDSFLISEYAFGLDGLLSAYESESIRKADFERAFVDQIGDSSYRPRPYCVSGNKKIFEKFSSNHIRFGLTITAPGFYGPQLRNLRLKPANTELMGKLVAFAHDEKRFTNFEMETAGIYGLSKLLGHRAISLSAILANRASGEFSNNPQKTVDNLIEFTLDRLTK